MVRETETLYRSALGEGRLPLSDPTAGHRPTAGERFPAGSAE
jgi:hypothetical protein